MNITTTQLQEYTKITIEKERFDVAAMQVLKEEISQVLEEKDAILLDMSKVTFLDSSGLSVLISILKTVKKREQGQLKLCALNEQPKELMTITQLSSVFEIIEICE